MKSGISQLPRDSRWFGPRMHEDPYRVYKELRETHPVLWDDAMQAWILTRYADVALVLNDRRFSARRVARVQERFQGTKLQPLFDVLGGRMSEYDEPDHKRLRALVHDAFVRTAVQQWEPRIRARVDSLLEQPTRRQSMEFISEVAVPLPLLVISELLGVPDEDLHRVRAWCDQFAKVALNYFAGMSDEEMLEAMRGVLEFREYLHGHVSARQAAPRHDLLSSLVQAEHEDERLTLDELLTNSLLLLAAGNETTTCLLGNGLAALLQHPEQQQMLRDDMSLLPNAIEEFLRYDSPVQFLGRIALEDVTLSNTTIRRGDLVVPVLGAANRDPERFTDPDRFDVTRAHVPHVAFGHGSHFCVGAQLARLEALVTFTTILERFPKLELTATQPLRHQENFNIRCLKQLPLRMT